METKMKAKTAFSWKSDFQPPNTTNTVITCSCGWCCAFSCIVWYEYKTTGRLNRDVNVRTGAADDRESKKSADCAEARHWGSLCCSISGTHRRRREVMERMRAARGQQRRLTGRQKEVEEASQLSGFSVKVATLRGNQVLMRRQHTTGSELLPTINVLPQSPITVIGACNHAANVPVRQMMDKRWCHQDVIICLANDRKCREGRSQGWARRSSPADGEWWGRRCFGASVTVKDLSLGLQKNVEDCKKKIPSV